MPYRLIAQMIQAQPCHTISSRSTVLQAAKLMKLNHVSALMVEGPTHRLLGIVTERDIVFRTVAAGGLPGEMGVTQIMTQNPRSITVDKPFGHALHMMYEGEFRHVPVVDEEGCPIGMVSARDALSSDAMAFDQELVRREEITQAL